MRILLLSVSFFAAVYHPAKHFENTNWVSKVSNKYVASINLRGSNYAVRYNTKSAQTYRGCYSISKDTLIIKERDDSRGAVTYHKIKFVLKDNELHYFSNEELINHQWIKARTGADKNTVFTKI
ncbi:MAG: hypothetical protein ACRYFB_04120 [Janthinobacterium lividum]